MYKDKFKYHLIIRFSHAHFGYWTW